MNRVKNNNNTPILSNNSNYPNEKGRAVHCSHDSTVWSELISSLGLISTLAQVINDAVQTDCWDITAADSTRLNSLMDIFSRQTGSALALCHNLGIIGSNMEQ